MGRCETPEPFWQWWVRMLPPAPEPEPEPSPWALEKSANRLWRMTEKIENGRWIPKFAYRASGKALREFQESRELLATAGEAQRRERR
jgi:hypothetical protein